MILEITSPRSRLLQRTKRQERASRPEGSTRLRTRRKSCSVRKGSLLEQPNRASRSHRRSGHSSRGSTLRPSDPTSVTCPRGGPELPSTKNPRRGFGEARPCLRRAGTESCRPRPSRRRNSSSLRSRRSRFVRHRTVRAGERPDLQSRSARVGGFFVRGATRAARSRGGGRRRRSRARRRHRRGAGRILVDAERFRGASCETEQNRRYAYGTHFVVAHDRP